MGENKEWHPCDKERGFCTSLSNRVKHPNEKGYGFFALIIMDLTQKQAVESLKGVMYKTERKDRGLMLNYCPFCGSKIDWWREKEEVSNG